MNRPDSRGREPERAIEVTLCPDGPLLVRGATHIVDTEGVRHAVQRPVVAVCRCGTSRRRPWCDGMHKLLAVSQ